MNPTAIVREAIRAVPALKYGLGVAGLFGLIAIIAGFNLDLRIALLAAFLMPIWMVMLVIFAEAAKGPSKTVAISGQILIWFTVLLMVGVPTLLLSSVFFRWPLNVQDLIAHPSATPLEKTTSVTPTVSASETPRRTSPIATRNSPSPPAPSNVLAQAQFSMDLGTFCDLETGTLSVNRNDADFEWSTRGLLVPANGSSFLSMNNSRYANLSSSEIQGFQFKIGSVNGFEGCVVNPGLTFVYRTRNGHPGKLFIGSTSNGHLIISFTTFK